MQNTGETKYGHLAKQIPIQSNVGTFDKCAFLDKAFFDWDSISMRYGLVGRPGVITEETDKLHTHDYDQILWFVSSDPDDMLELGAEVEVSLGTKGVRHRFNIPSVVVIPKGTPHFSPLVRSMTRKFYFLSINCTSEFKADIADESMVLGAGPWAEWRSEYKSNIVSLKFARKGAFHYGSAMSQDSGGTFAHINSSMTNIPITMTWQTVTLPHSLGPRNDAGGYSAHVHTFDETLMFLSLDQDDLTELHAESEYCIGEDGKDQECFTVTKATAMVMKTGVYHLPLTFKQVDKPLIFISLSNR